MFKFIYVFLIELIQKKKRGVYLFNSFLLKKKKVNNMFYFNVKSLYSYEDYACYYIKKKNKNFIFDKPKFI